MVEIASIWWPTYGFVLTNCVVYGLEFKFWSKIYERKFKLMIEIIVVMAPMWWPPYWFGLIIYAKYGYKFYFCSIIYGT
jgi:hypothetical protein